MLAGRCFRWPRNAPASRMRKWLLSARRAIKCFSPSIRISASLFSIGGFQREVESSCSGSFPNLPKKWRTPPWRHCFSLSQIYAGTFALSHVSEFESGPCARPRSADRWRHDATKISYMYRARRFFVLRRIGNCPATACARRHVGYRQTEPLITLDSTWTPLQLIDPAPWHGIASLQLKLQLGPSGRR